MQELVVTVGINITGVEKQQCELRSVAEALVSMQEERKKSVERCEAAAAAAHARKEALVRAARLPLGLKELAAIGKATLEAHACDEELKKAASFHETVTPEPPEHAPPGETYEDEDTGVILMDGRFIDVMCGKKKGKYETTTRRVHMAHGKWVNLKRFAKESGSDKGWKNSVMIVDPPMRLSTFLEA